MTGNLIEWDVMLRDNTYKRQSLFATTLAFRPHPQYKKTGEFYRLDKDGVSEYVFVKKPK